MRISALQNLLLCLMGALLTGMAFVGVWLRGVTGSDSGGTAAVRALAYPPSPAAEDWPGAEVWAGPEEARGSARIARYELAGTFQVFDGEPEGVESAALVDDQETGSQRIVREGDTLGMFQVGSIAEDRLTLVRGGRSWVLTLSGVEVVRSGAVEEPPSGEITDPRDLPALETTRFGKRVKENYWILEREAVKDYIDEMMQPQNMIRTANLYRSFSQMAQHEEDENVGFQIGMKAEQDFFDDMGLQDGDIIRRVNSMKMRTQRRAEYLLREFYRDNMSAVVLDVERDGNVQQHIYLVR